VSHEANGERRVRDAVGGDGVVVVRQTAGFGSGADAAGRCRGGVVGMGAGRAGRAGGVAS
jgi:hypothetical protein